MTPRVDPEEETMDARALRAALIEGLRDAVSTGTGRNARPEDNLGTFNDVVGIAMDFLRDTPLLAAAREPVAPAEAQPPAPASALEAAFTKAVNAPSRSGRGIAVPHYQDVEAIWSAIEAAIRGTTETLDAEHSS